MTLVLIVDDEESVCRALAQTLEIEDFEVLTATNGRDALRHIEYSWPGIVITDINMPVMDGMELLREIHTIDQDLPVTMLTGHGDISVAVDAMRAGAYDFLEKPFPTDQLLEVVPMDPRVSLMMRAAIGCVGKYGWRLASEMKSWN